ncbi:sirohydrochlorin chelatase [Salibacterium aidingense]|uniref:sirohydrochlorin chelatase n=1 Tax=Salibacterium aidingense TaxID=384933 RepID=UPI0004206E69|nr:sirohydrochlorin chelatase [Salibacterium aidingense]
MKQGVLYVGHGTRVPEGSRQLKAFVEEAKKEIPCPIQETCFLELSEPNILEGAKRCVEQGADTIAVVPVLLLSAGHIKEDIPEELSKVQTLYPHLTIQYGAPFGHHPQMIRVLIERLEARGWRKGEDAEILLVGRGSSDEAAIRDFHTIAQDLHRETGVERVKTAFLAAAEPSFDEGLRDIARSRAGHVYIVPYLLFTGLLMQEMQEKIEKVSQSSFAALHLCDYLGYDKQLMKVLQQKTEETLEELPFFERSGKNV